MVKFLFCNRLLAWLSFFFLVGVPVGVACAALVDYGLYPHLDRILEIDGEATSVEAYSLFGTDYFAVANETVGVSLFKVVGDEVVHIIDHHVLGSERDIAVRDWTAFVATASVGISSLVLAIPESPIEQDSLNLPGTPVRLAVSSTHAYVACGAGGLAVVDITNPALMNLVGNYGTEVRAVSLDGNRLGVVNEDRFEILDISIPSAPVFLGSYPGAAAGSFSDGVLRGEVAYICLSNRVERLDVSDPAAITLLAELPLNFPYHLYGGRFSIAQDELLLCADSYLAFLDFETGLLKRESKGFGSLTDVAVLGGKMMVTESDRIGIFNDGLHEPPEPSTALDFTEVMYPKGIMMDDIVYGASLSPPNGLGAFAISGSAPMLLWSLDLGLNVGSIYAMDQEGTLVAALTGNGRMAIATVFRTMGILRGSLELYHFNPPPSFRVLSFLDEETLIALDDAEEGFPRNFRVIDVSDPDHPYQIGHYDLAGGFGTHLLTTGSLVLVTDDHTVEFYDGQDRQNFKFLATHDFGETGIKFYVKGDHLYLVHRGNSFVGHDKIQTWNISNPLQPSITSELNLPKPNDFTIAGNFAYQAGSGLILDLSDPAHPVPAGNFSLLNTSESQMHEVLASEKYILPGWLHTNSGRLAHAMVAQESGTVSLVDQDQPSRAPGLGIEAVPNPFNPRTELRFELAAPALTRLEIFDLRGRLVADLGEKHREKGLHTVKWEGRGLDGRKLSSGVYVARVVTPLGSAAAKIVLAR